MMYMLIRSNRCGTPYRGCRYDGGMVVTAVVCCVKPSWILGTACVINEKITEKKLFSLLNSIISKFVGHDTVISCRLILRWLTKLIYLYICFSFCFKCMNNYIILDSGNIVNISGNIFLYPPKKSHPILLLFFIQGFVCHLTI